MDDDESFDEEDEDDFIHNTLSGDEEEIPSYRGGSGPNDIHNHMNHSHHEKLNESTADFNKEIR